MWNRTLAGLTIPGPCRDGEYGESHRLCTYAGTWAPVDYEQCFQQGCGEDAGWPSTPARVTLRRDCGAGYRTGTAWRTARGARWRTATAVGLQQGSEG